MQFKFGYVQPAEEVAILTAQQHHHPLDELKGCATLADVLALKRAAQDIRISEELKRYIVDLVGATRTAAGRATGRQPARLHRPDEGRAGAGVVRRLGFCHSRAIQELAVPVIAHRLVMEPQARFSGRTARIVVDEILKQIPVPA